MPALKICCAALCKFRFPPVSDASNTHELSGAVDIVTVEQQPRAAGVLAGDQLCGAKFLEHAQCDVGEVPDRRRTDDQAPDLRLGGWHAANIGQGHGFTEANPGFAATCAQKIREMEGSPGMTGIEQNALMIGQMIC